MQRRIPKRGFTNIFKREFAVVNVGQLNLLDKGTTVTPELLIEKGLLKKMCDGGLKILGGGTIDRSLTITGARVTEAARKKIEAVGGTIA